MDDIWHKRIEGFTSLDEDGGVAIEYGLIAALIALALVGALTSIGDALQGPFNDMTNAVGSSTAGGDGGSGG